MNKQRSSLVVIAAAFMALSFTAAETALAGRLTICAEHSPSSGELKVLLSNGCVSSSIHYLGQDLAVEIDQNRALISVTGGFNYEELPPGRIVTADCGGGKTMTIKAEGIDARRYSVVHGDDYVGVMDLTDANGRVCAKPVSTGYGNRPLFMAANWQPVDYSGWERDSAATVLGALQPIYAWHPESLEGNPAMDIKMAPWPGVDAMQVVITMTGFLDDSVAGERYVALVRPGGEGWTVGGLWRRNLCSRGAQAGQWTKDNCP